MKKILLTFFFLVLCCGSASAIVIKVKQDSTKQKKYTLRFTGRIDAAAYFDTYKGVESQNGLVYYMPARPAIDPVTGEDANLNFSPNTRFSVASSRFGLGGSIQYNEKNSVDALVEMDFLGPNTTTISTIRLRHAYARLNLGNSSILFGQTSHLIACDENLPANVTFGAGFPFSVITRPVQFRFTQRLMDSRLELSASATMFSGKEISYQSQALLPDLSLKARYGDPKSTNVILFGGYRSLKNLDDKMNAFYGGFSAKWDISNGYTARAMSIYGSDLSVFTIIGGLAKTSLNGNLVPINAMSSYVDFSTPKYKSGFQFGIFYGFQQNLGTPEAVDLTLVDATPVKDLNQFWSLSPRAWYHYKNLSFGLEYMYSQSSWMEQKNEYYCGVGDPLIAGGNRLTLLCRFTF